MDTIAGAIDAGVRYLSVYTFSTENWKRSPAEVSFIMNYASDVLARRTDQLAQWGVHVRWSGRRPRLWTSVIKALEKPTARPPIATPWTWLCASTTGDGPNWPTPRAPSPRAWPPGA